MNYENYSEWKGWMNKVPFGQLSVVEREKFRLQLECCGIPYKNINALEIGYGNGGFFRFLKDNGSTVEGVEVQEPLLQAAKDFGGQAHSSLDEVSQGPYDLVVAFDVLEHLTVDQLQELFARAAKLLKSDGVMLFRFPNADSFAGIGAQNGDFTHITAIGRTKLQQLVEPYGFAIERFEAEISYPRRVVINAIRRLSRQLFMKLIGVGNTYFFATNVVAVVRKKCARP